MRLIEDLWYKPRHLISVGYDESLEYISKKIPLKIHEINSGTECWTWTIPERWEIKEGWIEELDGKRILDIKQHPLHIVSYSLPINKIVSKEELLKHIHTRKDRPNAIPFEFKYYQRDWGFSVQHNKLKEFSKDKYKVFIDSKFTPGKLKVGECTIKGKTEEIIVLVVHLCHPSMVNDDLSGVAVLVDIINDLMKKDNYYTYKCLFLPETIGSIAYLSQNEDKIPKMKFGIFLEMLGNDNIHALQQSRQGNTKLDKIARKVLEKNTRPFREGSFREIISNDEMVFNGPGINIPMISISRFPYPEYHTSDDTPKIISKEKLDESKKIILEILDILDSDFIPKRKFKGPIFLSRYGLWVDWRDNMKLNQNIEKIMLNLEGDKSVFEISNELDLEYEDVLQYINAFEKHNLIERV